MAGHDRQDLERRSDAAMMEIYERAGAEAGYWASRYLQMLRRRGGLETARYLVGQEATSDGSAGRLAAAYWTRLSSPTQRIRPRTRARS